MTDYHKFVHALDVYLQVCKETKDDKEEFNQLLEMRYLYGLCFAVQKKKVFCTDKTVVICDQIFSTIMPKASL